jgi:membrane protease subunit HflC
MDRFRPIRRMLEGPLKMNRTIRLAAITLTLAMLAFVAARAFVVVDETEYVLVTQFGRIVAVYGDQESETGLHFKWPWQSSTAVDRRLQVFDPPAREMLTGDKRNLEVASYVVWRVNDPVRFVRSAATLGAAESRLNERVSAALSSAIGARELATLASTDAKVWNLDALTDEVRTAVAPAASEELGAEVVDVRLRRFNHPLEVRPAVFDLIRSERRQVAEKLRAEGNARYETLTSQADRQRDAILAQADAEAERIRGQADAEATRLSNEAHARDPRFYEFLRTLESYRAILDEKATIVLSSASPLLKLLAQGPADDLLGDQQPPVSARPTGAKP